MTTNPTKVAQAFLLLSLSLILGLVPSDTAAQVTDSIPPTPVCPTCKIEITKTVHLGSEEGEGFVDRPDAVSRNRGRYLVVNSSLPYEIRIFDSDGKFLGFEGGLGQGPGEYQMIWDLFTAEGDTLFVLDMGNHRLSKLSPELAILNTTRLIPRPMQKGFIALPDGGFVLNAPYPDSDGNIALIHRMDAEGKIVRSFSWNSSASPAGFSNPEGSLRIPALSKEGDRLFVARRESPIVEEWNLEGQLLRTISMFDRGWLDDLRERDQSYSPGIQHLRVDGEGRLWILARSADPQWEETMVPQRHGSRWVQAISDYNKYWDSVIEVWDLSQMRVLVRKRFPEFLHGFLESGEVYSFRISESSEAFVDIQELQVVGDSIH